MQLLAHIGLNKAGSTYLQELLRLNSARLDERGILYPATRGPRDAGNAAKLALDLRDRRVDKVRTALQGFEAEATRRGSRTVFLSSEYLYHRLVDPGLLASFASAYREAGFERCRLLVLFRDPVPHSISCYCHRAGQVETLAGFEAWLSNSYELFAELRGFLANTLAHPDFDVVPVAQEANGLKSVLESFADVEGLAHPEVDRVNVSITPGEAEIVRQMAMRDQMLALAVKRRFKLLDRSQKYDDPRARSALERAAAAAVAAERELIAELEKTLVYEWDHEPPAESSCGDAPVHVLSSDQLVALEIGVQDRQRRSRDVARRALRALPEGLRHRVAKRIQTRRHRQVR